MLAHQCSESSIAMGLRQTEQFVFYVSTEQIHLPSRTPDYKNLGGESRAHAILRANQPHGKYSSFKQGSTTETRAFTKFRQSWTP